MIINRGNIWSDFFFFNVSYFITNSFSQAPNLLKKTMKFVSGFHLDGATIFFHHTVFIFDNFHIPFLPTFQPFLMLPIDVPQFLRIASVHISLAPFTPSYHQRVLLSGTIMKNKGHRRI